MNFGLLNNDFFFGIFGFVTRTACTVRPGANSFKSFCIAVPDGCNILTTSIRSKYIITPPDVPHGTFFTSSVCNVTCIERYVVINGIIK
ncbi:hypothetical protein DERP_008524 [Dermatophagoides pteronyssinus]|uniref:Uncharacterized protein n=1 Tax=Dermatophagoides pteronyssinus TaxID=6956 RepID=A0ABQ8IVJ0_DERPT|nr:hypothetical protein DERP_008524 [Dermatophagoides pteronyssinus]